MENNNTNNINDIEKPISLIIEEAKQTIIKGINDANLHPTLLEPIMKDLYLETQELARTTAERERAEYERLLSQSISDIEKE